MWLPVILKAQPLHRSLYDNMFDFKGTITSMWRCWFECGDRFAIKKPRSSKSKSPFLNTGAVSKITGGTGQVMDLNRAQTHLGDQTSMIQQGA